MRVNGLIVGGGIIGSALAYELSRKGVKDLHVVDPDLDGALSATERNAGGVRHLWQQQINIDLARHSISLFEKIKDEIGFQQTGYLWLIGHEKRESGEDLFAHLAHHNLEYQMWDVPQIQAKYPFLDKLSDVAFALFGTKDGLINSNALKTYFRTQAKQNGAIFHNRRALVELSEGTGVEVKLGTFESEEDSEGFLKAPTAIPASETWNADFVVLCTGAWSAQTLKTLIPYPAVEPIRRQIAVFKSEGFDMTPYGMVVDTSGVYFHPEGGNILAGLVLKDEPSGFRFESDADFFESHIWPALYDRSHQLERLKPVTSWAGLYSYTPDTTGILGRVPGHKRIFESHGFTGRGVMQSYGAAIAMAELIVDNRFTTIDASVLSRERFSDPKRPQLFEAMHI